MDNKQNNIEYAGFWLRVVAIIIDIILINILSYVVIFFVVRFGVVETEKMEGLVSLIIITLPWLYFAGMESSDKQATVGKIMTGIKVTNYNNKKITFGQATGRFFSKILSGLLMGVGYIMVVFTPKKQALHDFIAKTLVVKEKYE